MKLKLIGLCFLVAGCSTICRGTRQEVSFTSMPSGASVYVNDQYRGETPLVLSMPRKQMHEVSVQMDGYAPNRYMLVPKRDNLLATNLIDIPVGTAIGAVSGATGSGLVLASSIFTGAGAGFLLGALAAGAGTGIDVLSGAAYVLPEEVHIDFK